MTEKSILIVEDSKTDELLTIRALKKINVANRIDVVRDGQAALDYLFGDTLQPLPAVVMLDLKLPKVDGHQVLEKIRADERTQLLPVVILTSSDEEKDILRAYKSGVNSFVTKPVGSAEFADAVAKLGLYWVVTNKPAS